MQNYIIDSFIYQNRNTIHDIYNYILRYNIVEINDIKLRLADLTRYKIIFLNNKTYELTNEGNVVLNDHKYYYAKIITRFFKKYSKSWKKYKLKEIRLEQQKLRNYLINNKIQRCIICDKYLPLCLLETAHLKPRGLLN